MVNRLSDNMTKGRAIHVDAGCHNMNITSNIIVNYNHGFYGGKSDNFTIAENYMENNVMEINTDIHPVYLRESNHSKIIWNTLAGVFAYGTFEIVNTGGIGNIVEFNTVIVNSTDFLNTTLVISSDFNPDRLNIQQDPANLITLSDCNYNYIGYNVMLLPVESSSDPDNTDDPEDPGDLVPDGGSEASIGGYDAILFVSIASVAILTIMIRRRRR